MTNETKQPTPCADDMPPRYKLVIADNGDPVLNWPGGCFPCCDEARVRLRAWQLWEKYSGLTRADLEYIRKERR